MRPAGPQKRYTAYMRTPSGLMPEAVPEGTTRAFVNKTDKRRKAGKAEAGPSAQHSPSVDGEDEGGVFDEEEATQEEDGHCGGSCGWSGGGGGGRRSTHEVAARWDEVSALRFSSALERNGAQSLYTLEPDDDDGVPRPPLATYRCSSRACQRMGAGPLLVVIQCSLCNLTPLCADCDYLAHSYFHTHPRWMCWGEQGCAARAARASALAAFWA